MNGFQRLAISGQQERRDKVLAAMVLWDRWFPGLNPTVRDLCSITEINSTSQVARALDELAEQGHVKKYPMKARGVVFLRGVN